MEKCKSSFVPKLAAKQNNFTRKFISDMFKRRLAGLEKKHHKEPSADLEKEIKRVRSLLEKHEKSKSKPKGSAALIKQFTDAYCNPGCEGTLFQEGDFDAESYVRNHFCKRSPKACKDKTLVESIKRMRKTISKNGKRILDDDSFYVAFVNKTKKAKYIKDGALSGCASMSLV